MSEQISIADSRLLRSAHRVINPVSSQEESVILIESEHPWGNNGISSASNCFQPAFMTSLSATQQAPDGSSTAVQWAASASSVYHNVAVTGLNQPNYHGYTGPQANGLFAAQLYVKAGSLTKVECCLLNNVAALYRFDLTNGTQVSGPSDGKIRIEPACPSNPAFAGWYRIFSVGAVYGASVSTAAMLVCYLVKGTTGYNGGSGFASDGSSDYIYVWGGWSEHNKAACAIPQWSVPSGQLWASNPGSDLLACPLGSLTIPQAMTTYLEWFDRGNAINAGSPAGSFINGQPAFNPGVFRIGDVLDTAANSLDVMQTTTGFTGTFNNGGTTSVSSVALVPSYGDLVSLRAVLDATGKLTLFASDNGAAEIVGSTGAAAGLPANWNEATLWPSGLGASARGDMALRYVKLFAGNVSQAAAQAA